MVTVMIVMEMYRYLVKQMMIIGFGLVIEWDTQPDHW